MLKPGSASTDVLGMAQIEIETGSFGAATPVEGRFACPSCGSMLRVGAILCPGCGADLWVMAHGGPVPSPHAGADRSDERSLPGPMSADGRRAQRSLVMAAVALGAKLVLPVVAGAVQQLSWVWSVLGWATTLVAVYAIYAARRVADRLDGTGDERARKMARFGLVLGMASLAYVVSVFVTSAIDQVVR